MAHLHSLLLDPQYDWSIKLGDENGGLIKSARLFSPNLFLFDDYHEKPIEANASDQLVYTYTIINLYDLFFDSGRYIVDNSSPFQTEIASTDAQYICFFYDSLRELRSIICHNKPIDSIRYKKFHKELGWNRNEWGCFDYLRRPGYCFSYEDSFKLLTQSSVKVLDILKKSLDDNNDEQKKEQFEKAWYNSIIEWYKNNTTVHIRGIQAYLNLAPTDFRKKCKNKYGPLQDDQYINKVEALLANVWPPLDDWNNLYDDHFRADADNPMQLSPLSVLKTLLDQNL